ncbi:MAG: GDSL-type esterase/lipase family protein [Pirellulaceae bacterium]
MPDAPAISTDAQPQQVSARALLARAARTVWLTSLVVISLLSFPSVVLWMLAFWLLWHTVALARGKPGWVPLLACVAIPLAKRVYWAPGLSAFGGLAIIVAAWRAAQARKGWSAGRGAWIGSLCLWAVWTYAMWEWQAIATCNHAVSWDATRAVACIGDSLTSGLLPDRGYPHELQALIRPPVVNLGQSGITTEGGLDLLSKLTEVRPQVVVIELGGHDFLKDYSRAATKANLNRLIKACRTMGAEVVLIEIPRGFMMDPWAGLEREIAHEQDVELVADSAIRQLVLWSPIAPPGMWLRGTHLSDDGIHTNARGSKYLARYVADALQRMYGEQIRADSVSRNQADILK